jgi:hypothetical protein
MSFPWVPCMGLAHISSKRLQNEPGKEMTPYSAVVRIVLLYHYDSVHQRPIDSQSEKEHFKRRP